MTRRIWRGALAAGLGEVNPTTPPRKAPVRQFERGR